jgi:hypothetical protein
VPTDTDQAPLVTFAVIGAGKAGTTWLFEVLAAHDQVTVARTKETMFFDRYYNRGVRWYHSLFPVATGQAVGEASNTYLAAADVPERIAAYNPAMHLVALLRDPVERAFSNYLFFVRNGQVNGTFEDALEQRPDILDHGFYGRSVARYRNHFPAGSIHLDAFDDLCIDADGVARRVLQHIGVSDPTVPEVAQEQILPASLPRNRFVARMVKESAVVVRRLGAPALVSTVKRGRLPGLLYRRFEERPQMNLDMAARLRDAYAADVELLGTLTGRDWAGLWWPGHPKTASGGAGLVALPRPRRITDSVAAESAQ